MSDEDHEVDIESDEDDSSVTQFMTQAEKRAHHNALERKRRDHIKESFHNLRDSVPSLSGEKVNKASRAQILKQATDYIQLMSKKNGSIQGDIDDLKKQNHVLEQQVRGMEKSKMTGQFAAQASARNASPATSSEGRENYAESESDSETEVPMRSRRKKMKIAAQ